MPDENYSRRCLIANLSVSELSKLYLHCGGNLRNMRTDYFGRHQICSALKGIGRKKGNSEIAGTQSSYYRGCIVYRGCLLNIFSCGFLSKGGSYDHLLYRAYPFGPGVGHALIWRARLLPR